MKAHERYGHTLHGFDFISSSLRSVVHMEDPRRRGYSICGHKIEVNIDDHTAECKNCLRVEQQRRKEAGPTRGRKAEGSLTVPPR